MTPGSRLVTQDFWSELYLVGMLEGQRLFASLACLSYQGPSLSERSFRDHRSGRVSGKWMICFSFRLWYQKWRCHAQRAERKLFRLEPHAFLGKVLKGGPDFERLPQTLGAECASRRVTPHMASPERISVNGTSLYTAR